jgi:ATP-dependent helicase/nuclease subunit B
MEGLAARLDEPAAITRIGAPQPRPPVDARPQSFPVTQIEKLMRDPYAIYARRILRLKKLDPLGEAFDARHLGNLFHKVLEDYARDAPPGDAAAQAARLEALFDAHAGDYGYRTENDPFWRARAREAFAFLADWDAGRRKTGAPAVTEGEGGWAFALDGRDYALSARADRIDRLNDGAVFIADYKTGKIPSMKQSSTFSPQLPLTGLIAAAGGFAALGPAPVAGFEYVHVIGRKPGEKPVEADGADAREIMDAARDGLFNLFRHFADPETSYTSQPRPHYADDYGDYDHLARRKERNAQGSDGEGDSGGGE